MALELGPLPFRDAVKFFPDYAADERLMAYNIFGGVPFYLQLCDQHASLAENVLQLLLTSAGALVDEPTVLLRKLACVLNAVMSGQSSSAASDADWAEAVLREAVICPLSAVSRLRSHLVAEAARNLGLSERRIYGHLDAFRENR